MKYQRDRFADETIVRPYPRQSAKTATMNGMVFLARPKSFSQQTNTDRAGVSKKQVAKPKSIPDNQTARGITQRTRRHILCVDDEPDILDVAALSLEMVGEYQVTRASSGGEACRLASEVSPDLILLDVMMPVMAGPATLKALRRDERTAQIPIVFMTARVQPEEVEEYFVLGACAVIHKPFDPMLLATQLGDILDADVNE